MTEAGFGADLGAEKFFDIKCRKAGCIPAATVIVATVRALKMHGGVGKDELKKENVEALKKGLANLGRHIENVKKFGVPIAVAVNHFITDTDAEIEAVARLTATSTASRPSTAPIGRRAARAPRRSPSMSPTLADKGSSQFHPIYGDDMPLWDKVRTIAREIYRADDIVADKTVRDQFKAYRGAGLRQVPDLHGEDAVFLLDRSQSQGRAVEPCRADPRGEAVGGGRVHRRHLRRHHDHAGPAQGAVGGDDRPRRQGPDRGIVLKRFSGC